jgi:hypothetical protein
MCNRFQTDAHRFSGSPEIFSFLYKTRTGTRLTSFNKITHYKLCSNTQTSVIFSNKSIYDHHEYMITQYYVWFFLSISGFSKRFKLFRVRPDVRRNFSVTWDRQNAWRWPSSLLNFASQTCRCLQSPIFVYFCLYNQILTSHWRVWLLNGYWKIAPDIGSDAKKFKSDLVNFCPTGPTIFDSSALILSMSLNFIKAWRNDKW